MERFLQATRGAPEHPSLRKALNLWKAPPGTALDLGCGAGRDSLALLRDGLQAIDAELRVFSEVRGRGLMLGAQLRDPYAGRAGEILDACAREGLMALQAGPDVLRFVPALTITDADVAEGLQRLARALRSVIAAAPAGR